MKNPLTPAGIEPATFRFVAQHLNHCATAVRLLNVGQYRIYTKTTLNFIQFLQFQSQDWLKIVPNSADVDSKGYTSVFSGASAKLPDRSEIVRALLDPKVHASCLGMAYLSKKIPELSLVPPGGRCHFGIN